MIVVLGVVEIGLRVNNFPINELLILVKSSSDHGFLYCWEIRVELLCLLFLDQEVGPDAEEWLDDDFDVPSLENEGIACASVEELRDSILQLFLDVSLLVVLFHLKRHPLEIRRRTLARIAVVGRVDAHVQDHLLILRRVLREPLGRLSALERADFFKVVRNVR